MHYKETAYGFEFGSAKVSRLISDEKGWVVIGLETPKHTDGKEIQIYVTKTGKVRVSDSRGEWTAPKVKNEQHDIATCEWTQEDWDGDTWGADCGAVWSFIDGGPVDNQMKFCPVCGLPLVEIKYDDADTEQEEIDQVSYSEQVSELRELDEEAP